MKKIPDWCVMKDAKTCYCKRCKQSHELLLPMPITAYTKAMKKFGETHQNCQEVEV